MQKTKSMDRVRLSKMTIADRLKEKRQAQALKNYRRYQRQWGAFKKEMSAKLGKSADSLVVSKSEEYREVVEEYALITAAIPAHIKYGGDYWEMTLRGGGERNVQIGNVFSGLFCVMQDKKGQDNPELVRVP